MRHQPQQVTPDAYPIEVAEVPAGEFTADDLGVCELEPHHRAWTATSPAWPDLSWVDSDPARCTAGLRMLIDEALADLARAGATAPPILAGQAAEPVGDDPLPGLAP